MGANLDYDSAIHMTSHGLSLFNLAGLSALKNANLRPLPRLMDLDEAFPPDHDGRWSILLSECTYV